MGLGLEHIAKVNVWLKNIQDLPEMEKIFLKYFEKDHYPARMTATTQFIDADCLVMVDGVAVTPAGARSEYLKGKQQSDAASG